MVYFFSKGPLYTNINKHVYYAQWLSASPQVTEEQLFKNMDPAYQKPKGDMEAIQNWTQEVVPTADTNKTGRTCRTYNKTTVLATSPMSNACASSSISTITTNTNALLQLIVGKGGPVTIPHSEEDRPSFVLEEATWNMVFSNPCHTIGSPELIMSGVFQIANVEVWMLTPANTVPQAKKLELGCQFICNHGNFVQEVSTAIPRALIALGHS